MARAHGGLDAPELAEGCGGSLPDRPPHSPNRRILAGNFGGLPPDIGKVLQIYQNGFLSGFKGLSRLP